MSNNGFITERLKTARGLAAAKLRRRAFIQRGELRRLFRWRQQKGDLVVLPETYLLCIAAAIATGEPGSINLGRKRWKKWHGLDVLSLRDDVRLLKLDGYDDDHLRGLITEVECRQRREYQPALSPIEIGERVKLTAAERTALRITTVEAMDETPANRAARVKGARRPGPPKQEDQARPKEPRRIHRQLVGHDQALGGRGHIPSDLGTTAACRKYVAPPLFDSW